MLPIRRSRRKLRVNGYGTACARRRASGTARYRSGVAQLLTPLNPPSSESFTKHVLSIAGAWPDPLSPGQPNPTGRATVCNQGGASGHLRIVESHEEFEALYRAHAGAVRAYAARRTDRATTDDVVAEVFLTVWRRRVDVPEDPLPWLLGIARRVMANKRRKDSRRAAVHDRLAAVTPILLVDERSADGLDPELEQALRSLSERDREILLLVAWDRLAPARAARALGVTPRTFAVRLHRARRRLARLLAKPDEEPSEDRPAAVEVS